MIPEPVIVTSTATSTGTSTAQALQQATAQAAQQAQAFSESALNGYFSHLGLLEFLGLVVSLAIFAAIIYFAIETGWWATRVDRFRDVILRSNMSKTRAQAAWGVILQHFYRGSDSDLKVAIIEADKLLNEALREAGMMGTQIGDRLKKATDAQIPNLDDVWQAHKLRNQIAHESNFRLKRDLAERALGIYESALKNMGLLDGTEQI